MDPIVTTLLPTAVKILQEIGSTEAGQKIISRSGKVMEIAIPLAKKASQIAIKFLAAEVGGTSGENEKTIKLSQSLDIVDNELSLPSSYRENQFKPISQKLSDDLDIIKGQNEILFLSNSIQYFIDSHRYRTGIDRGVSYALQYDIVAVCNHLKKQKETRFPGYLLHQFSSLAETIKELNVFYASILNDGHVPEFNEQEIKDDIRKGFGFEGRKGDMGVYIPHDMKARIGRELSLEFGEKQKPGSLISSFKDRILTREVEGEINEAAFDALFTLKEELVSNEELECQIVRKLKVLPDKKIIVHGVDGEDR